METLESLRSQIGSHQDLQSVVKTMKTLSAVNIRHYERAVEVLHQYNQVLEMGIQILLRSSGDLIQTDKSEHGQKKGYLIFGSDQGLCGSFNERITQLSIAQLSDPLLISPSPIVVGQRAAIHLEASGMSPEVCFSIPSSLSGVTPLIQDLLLAVDSWRLHDRVESLWVIYNQPQSSTTYHPEVELLLPIHQDWLQELQQRPWPTRQLPTHRIDNQRLLTALIQHYLFLSLYRACVGSLASENAARLVTMQNAERTIEDKIMALTATFHQYRQTQVTEELLDIISGFEALIPTDQEKHVKGKMLRNKKSNP